MMERFQHREQFVEAVAQCRGGDWARSLHLSSGQPHQKRSGAFGELKTMRIIWRDDQ